MKSLILVIGFVTIFWLQEIIAPPDALVDSLADRVILWDFYAANNPHDLDLEDEEHPDWVIVEFEGMHDVGPHLVSVSSHTEAYSVKSFHHALTQLQANHEIVELLIILGHGFPGRQLIGGGHAANLLDGNLVKGTCMGTDRLRWHDTAAFFEEVHKLMGEKSIIFLAGCHTGSGGDGTKLLVDISKICTNSVIIASTEDVMLGDATGGYVQLETVIHGAEQPVALAHLKAATGGKLVADLSKLIKPAELKALIKYKVNN